MTEECIQIVQVPELKDPLFIAGFDGWGNALDISRGMVDYLIRKLKAERFGKIDPDLFYRFDENRPVVEIEDGLLKKISPPGGFLYATQPGQADRDLIILKASEPHLRWFHFVDAILTLCQKSGVRTIVSLGSMYDNVLHTDTVISALASTEELLSELKAEDVNTINYKGPSAIHSTIHSEAKKRGIECLSLWCHCPYYLQGTTHFGLLSHLGALLSRWGGFELDTEDLDNTWRNLSKQIQGIIDQNPELQGMINDLRKAKVKGSWDMARKQDKVIHLEDFLKPR
ncbi:MAG: PAC2 family protein [Desulfobacteraceae bacterium]|jgi:proteasome assembly chaperone (PAC2) family protein